MSKCGTHSRLLTLNDPVVMEASWQIQIIYQDDDGDRTHHRVTIRTVSGEIYEDEGNFTVIPKPDSSGIDPGNVKLTATLAQAVLQRSCTT